MTTTAIIFQIQSFLILSLMTLGIIKRRQKNLHKKLMFSSIIWDVLLILQIELSRSAIKKASEALKNPLLLNIHIMLALSTVVLYGFLLFTGNKLDKGNFSVRKKHKMIGFTAYFLRILTFFTSFFAVS